MPGPGRGYDWRPGATRTTARLSHGERRVARGLVCSPLAVIQSVASGSAASGAGHRRRRRPARRSRSMPSEARSIPVPPSDSISSSAARTASRSYISFGTFADGPIVDRAVPLQTCRGRDQLADDDVLLQPEQPVDLALDRRVRENLGRLLERGRREERLGGERCLGDPQDHAARTSPARPSPSCTRVFSRSKRRGRPAGPAGSRCRRSVDPYLLHHLTDDQLDVLVVDVDALRLVDLLDFVDEVELRRRRALGAVAREGRRDSSEPSWSGSPGSTCCPFRREPRSPRELVFHRLRRLAASPSRSGRS